MIYNCNVSFGDALFQFLSPIERMRKKDRETGEEERTGNKRERWDPAQMLIHARRSIHQSGFCLSIH